MTGYGTTWDGAQWRLPALTQWRVTRTDGEPCDSFSLSFPCAAGDGDVLKNLSGFRGEWNGETVFTGVVDEITVSGGAGGRLAEVSGRGMAALLLDNQTRAAQYQTAQLADILRDYVAPLGITRVSAGRLPSLSNFAVDSGGSCWTALAGFCRHSAGIVPRFLADGTLELRKAPDSAAHRLLTENAAPISASLRCCRYGRISRQVLVDRATGAVSAADNAAFHGGRSQKVTMASGGTLRAGWRTAAQRIADGEAEAEVLTVTLPGVFLAEPRDTVEVNLTGLGAAGTYTVTAVESAAGPAGLRCSLTLV